MAVFVLIPPLAGAVAAALLFIAGRWGLAGFAGLEAAWLAVCGLGIALAALLLLAGSAISRLKARVAELAIENTQFERAVSERLARFETGLAGAREETRQNMSELGKPAPARFAEALRAAPALDSRPEPEPRAIPGESNVVKLDPGTRLRAGQDKRVRRPLKDIEDALASGRYEAWYQPVVSLPERSVHYLSGQPHLLMDGSPPLAPGAWLETAVAAGKRPQIDRHMLLDAIKLRRDLARQDKPCGVIWSIGRETLADTGVWSEIAQVLNANRALGNAFVCDVRLSDYCDLRPDELDALFTVREAGFQLGLRECNSHRVLANSVKSGIFKFVSADPRFIAIAAETADLRSRDITFIAAGVENEDDAIGLIDRDIKLAHGPLFAPAKPLRRDGGAARAPEGAA